MVLNTTEGTYLGDILKSEGEDYHSREIVTVLSGQNLAIGAVISKITKSIPTTGTAGEGNTGDGTMTGVAGGTKTKLGAYTMECVSIPEGAAVVPATGTAGGGNTGDGTMTGVADGGAAKIGTYTMECISVPQGAAVVPETGEADVGNTGAGTMTGVADGGAAKIGTYTMTCVVAPNIPVTGAQNIDTAWTWNAGGSGTIGNTTVGAGAKVGKYTVACVFEATGAAKFEVRDPNGLVIGQATEAVAFDAGGIAFTISDNNDFALGDGFDIDVVADGEGGEFEVVDPDGNKLPSAVIGTAYTNAQIGFTISDSGADFVVGDIFTVEVTEDDHDAGTFSVTDPDGYRLAADATVGSAYTNPQLNFTINDGSADFIVGDSFTVTVVAGSGKVRAINFSGVDGSQEAFGFVIDDYDASSADKQGVAIVRDATITTSKLVWPGGATSDQKAAALVELKAAGIVTAIEI